MLAEARLSRLFRGEVVIMAQVPALCQSTTSADFRPSCRSALHLASPVRCMAVLSSDSLFAQLLLGWPAHPCLWAGQNWWGSGVVGSFGPPSIPFFPLGFLLGASCAGMASLAMPALGAHYPLLFRWGTWMWEGCWMLRVVWGG